MIDILDNEIIMYYNGKRYAFLILCNSSDRYFLGEKTNTIYPTKNDRILQVFGYNTFQKQKELYQKVLGYFISEDMLPGYWPWCKSKEDILKILRYLNLDTTVFIDLRFYV